MTTIGLNMSKIERYLLCFLDHVGSEIIFKIDCDVRSLFCKCRATTEKF